MILYRPSLARSRASSILPVGERAVEVGGGHSHLHQLASPGPS